MSYVTNPLLLPSRILVRPTDTNGQPITHRRNVAHNFSNMHFLLAVILLTTTFACEDTGPYIIVDGCPERNPGYNETESDTTRCYIWDLCPRCETDGTSRPSPTPATPTPPTTPPTNPRPRIPHPPPPNNPPPPPHQRFLDPPLSECKGIKA